MTPLYATRVIRLRQTLALDPVESSVERAAIAVHVAVADFVIAIQQAQTSAEAEALHILIGPLVMALGACERCRRVKKRRLEREGPMNRLTLVIRVTQDAAARVVDVVLFVAVAIIFTALCVVF